MATAAGTTTTTKAGGTANDDDSGGGNGIAFVDYHDESRLEDVDRLVASDLSEPYSIFTYRYFLHRFPDLCILAVDTASGEVCGCVVGKIDLDTDDAAAGVGGGVAPAVAVDGGAESGKGGGDSEAACVVAGTAAAVNTAIQTGYIGMLAVSKSHRRRGIGKDLVRRVLKRMETRGCESVTLETVSLYLFAMLFGFVLVRSLATMPWNEPVYSTIV